MARHLLQNYSLQWAIAILIPTRFFAESTRFFTESTRFFAQQVSFFTEPTWFLFKTNSIGLQNRLNSLNRTDSTILQNQLGFFYRTDSIILLEPTRFFHWTDSVFWVSFFIINKVRAHSRLWFPAKGHIVHTCITENAITPR